MEEQKQKFHILYRYKDELTSSSRVVEAYDIASSIAVFYIDMAKEKGIIPALDLPLLMFEERYEISLDALKENMPLIIAIHTQELVDLMASSRG